MPSWYNTIWQQQNLWAGNGRIQDQGALRLLTGHAALEGSPCLPGVQNLHKAVLLGKIISKFYFNSLFLFEHSVSLSEIFKLTSYQYMLEVYYMPENDNTLFFWLFM